MARNQSDSSHHRQPVGEHRRSKRGCRGYDVGKKITGRKRQIMTDTDRRLLTVQVHAANIHDREGAKPLLRASRRRWYFIERFSPMADTQASS